MPLFFDQARPTHTIGTHHLFGDFEGVHLVGRDADTGMFVYCTITDEVLEDSFVADAKGGDPFWAFRANRAAIQRAFSAKYDCTGRGQMLGPGGG